jgi:hypothetical protein
MGALTKEEREQMEHALGRPRRVDGELDWRNHYCVGYTDDPLVDEHPWHGLRLRGLADRWVRGTCIYYRVTDDGKIALETR